jgi:hypothetical protein
VPQKAIAKAKKCAPTLIQTRFFQKHSHMCGRYRRTTQEEELARLYHIPIPKQTDLPISYNIAPSQKVLCRRSNQNQPVMVELKPATFFV